jgi:dTDP-4-amino-4,6-dideoxygalactose transaminase
MQQEQLMHASSNGLVTAASSATEPPPARRSQFLPYSPPLIGEEEITEIIDTLHGDWISTGPKTRAFEKQFAESVGAPGETCAMMNSCTACLHVALIALGIGPGDEVILPTLTFAATANVVEHVGARPVLVDVLPDTLCIDPMEIERAITARTRAIIPVHYGGHPAELDEIFALADGAGIAVLEDAAHAVPTWYRGVAVGSRQNFAAFSFYATKNMTTAEGGALTGRPDLLERVRAASLHGMSRDAWKRFDRTGSWRYDIVLPGYKYNMTDLQASLGIHQLRKLRHFHQLRRGIAARYNRAFQPYPVLQTPVERSYATSSWHLYVLRIRPGHLSIDRDEIIEELKERNIGCSVHYTPLHVMSYYREKYGYSPLSFPVAYAASERMISLPLHPGLTESDVDDVIHVVLDIVREFSL